MSQWISKIIDQLCGEIPEISDELRKLERDIRTKATEPGYSETIQYDFVISNFIGIRFSDRDPVLFGRILAILTPATVAHWKACRPNSRGVKK